MTNPALSIIVPMYNEELGISATLAALAPLRARGAEVIVADGGSTDASVSLAAQLSDAVLITSRGRAAQMNAGAAQAHGAVLLFLHADTRLPDQADRLIAEKMARSDKAWGRFDVRIVGTPFMLRVVATMMNLRSRLTGIATGDQAIFVRRDAFFAVGSFPLQPLMEDIELSRRLRQVGTPLCLRQRVSTSGRRWEARGVWRTIVLMWQLRLRYLLGASADTLSKEYR